MAESSAKEGPNPLLDAARGGGGGLVTPEKRQKQLFHIGPPLFSFNNNISKLGLAAEKFALPGDKPFPLTRSVLREFSGRKKKPEKCVTGEYSTPYCMCSDTAASPIDTFTELPDGALEEHRPYFAPIWLAYKRQTRRSHCFDIDDYPGSCLGVSVAPLRPFEDYNGKAGLLLELANLAIHEYNEKNCSIFKFEVLKIEKVNFSVTGASSQYWITVKVLNLSLATPIRTFQIHAGVQANDEKVIFCCRPKVEVTPGLPSCDVCFGRVRSLFDT